MEPPKDPPSFPNVIKGVLFFFFFFFFCGWGGEGAGFVFGIVLGVLRVARRPCF